MRSVSTLIFCSTFACSTFAFTVSIFPEAACFAQTAASPPFTPAPLTPEQRGDLYMARKMYREAIDVYRENAKNNPVIWDKIGIAYHQLGDLRAARKAYEHAIRLNKKYPDAINNVGTIFYAEKKYRSAINRYLKALRYAPDAASIWSNLGTAYYARGKFALMTQAYRKALELDPDVFEKRGLVGTEMEDRSVADRARYHFELARMYAMTGRNDLALQYLRKALEEGFKEKNKIEQDKDFAKLRETQEFKDLMALEPRVL